MKWSYKSSQPCWLLSFEWFAYFEHVVQSLLNTSWCLPDHVFWMYVLRSTPYHISLKYRCPDYCYVGIRYVYLTHYLNRDVLLLLNITRWFTYVCLNGIWYVGVMWFLFIMFSNFYQLDLHNKTQFALANSRCNIYKKSDQNLDLPWYNYSNQKYMFVDSLTGYIGPPNCVHYWV